MYTIRDVAHLANVSSATASLVVNGKSGVSPGLTQRVKAAMEALDYHPNQVARSLKVRRTLTVGMVIPDVTNPFFTDVMSGVEEEARRNGYSVILCTPTKTQYSSSATSVCFFLDAWMGSCWRLRIPTPQNIV